MLILFEQQEIEGNFIAIPVKVEFCCNENLKWCFRNHIDFIFDKKQVVKINNMATKDLDFYSFCKDCGKSHGLYMAEEWRKKEWQQSSRESGSQGDSMIFDNNKVRDNGIFRSNK